MAFYCILHIFYPSKICTGILLSLLSVHALTTNSAKSQCCWTTGKLSKMSVDSESLRREGSIWRHLAAIAVLGRMGLRPKTAMAARGRQIEPSPPCVELVF